MGQILLGEDSVDRHAIGLLNGAEDRRNPHQTAAVIPQTFQGTADGFAGGYRGKQQKNIFSPNHFLGIVPEDHLIIGVGLGCDNTDIIAAVEHPGARLGKLICQESADHLRAFQADNRINGRRSEIGPRQLHRRVFRHAVKTLDTGHIHIIVDMGVVGGKMPGNNADFYAFVAAGGNFLNPGFHTRSPFRWPFPGGRE